jgi:hypothetical protein
MNLGKKHHIEVEIYDAEIDYLKEYFKIMEDGGVDALAEECHARAFSMVLFNNIVSKLINPNTADKKDERLNFYHIITDDDDKNEILNRYSKFTGINFNEYEILEISIADVLMVSSKTKTFIGDYFYPRTNKMNLRKRSLIKSINDIYRLTITGRKYKQLLYIKCGDIKECNFIDDEDWNTVLSNCVVITKNTVTTYFEYQNKLK